MSKKATKKTSSSDWKKLAKSVGPNATLEDKDIKRLCKSCIILSSATIIFQALLAAISIIRHPHFNFAPASPAELNSGAMILFLLESIVIIYVVWSFVFLRKLKRVKDLKKARVLLSPVISCFLNWIVITISEAIIAFLFFYNGFGIINSVVIIAAILDIAFFIMSMLKVWDKKIGDKMVKIIKKSLLIALIFHLFAPLAFFAYTFIMVFVFYS